MRTLFALAVAGVALYWTVSDPGTTPPTPAAASTTESAVSAPEQPADAGSAAFPAGCKNLSECETYCLKPVNRGECARFLGLVPAAPAAPAKPSLRLPEELPPGPGECRTKAECDLYCRNLENEQECQDFDHAERRRVADRLIAGSPRERNCLAEGAPGRLVDLKAMAVPMTFEMRQVTVLCLPLQDGRQKISYGVDISDAPEDCADLSTCLTYCLLPENEDECLEWKGLPKNYRTTIMRRRGNEDEVSE